MSLVSVFIDVESGTPITIFFLIYAVLPGARPTNGISIDFEIRPHFAVL